MAYLTGFGSKKGTTCWFVFFVFGGLLGLYCTCITDLLLAKERVATIEIFRPCSMPRHQMCRICRGLDLMPERSLPSTAALKTSFSVIFRYK